MTCQLDHLTVTAPDLSVGKTWVEQRLQSPLSPGGEHPRMGTHNLLMRVHDTVFLEVIAVNPPAPPVGRPRWFALDDLPPQAGPGLRSWVARTSELHALTQRSPENLGPIEPMHRADLNWRITIPADGRPGLDSLAPALIDWQASPHPCTRLPDVGVTLRKLTLLHSDTRRVQAMLDALQLRSPVPVEVSVCPPDRAPHLVAEFDTPQGIRTLA